MMRAAVDAAKERARDIGMTPPHVFAVTILTSMSQGDLREVGLAGDATENAIRLARLSSEAGCTGVVCSAREADAIKRELGSAFPDAHAGHPSGRRTSGDQKRVTTPADAVRAGSDYLVVGRPITEAADPLSAARAILAEMREVKAP